MTSVKIYAVIGVAIAFLLVAGWGALGWSAKDAAEAKIETVEAENLRLISDLITERENVLTAHQLASNARAAAAAANARAEEIRVSANEMIEAFRTEEGKTDVVEDEQEPKNVAAPVPTYSCNLSDRDRDRLVREIPIRRIDAVSADPRVGQLRGGLVR